MFHHNSLVFCAYWLMLRIESNLMQLLPLNGNPRSPNWKPFRAVHDWKMVRFQSQKNSQPQFQKKMLISYLQVWESFRGPLQGIQAETGWELWTIVPLVATISAVTGISSLRHSLLRNSLKLRFSAMSAQSSRLLTCWM